jgi:hypothetical protein
MRHVARVICAVLALVVCVPAALGPARAELAVASTDLLRPVFNTLLGNPPFLRIEAVPDLYEGGYARISAYARNVVIKGMRIDEMWINLVGASLDPAALRAGTLKVLQLRDSSIYGKLRLANVQDFLNQQGAVQDVRLTADGDDITATGTLMYNGIPTHVRMQGVFQVYGEPEVFFHIEELFVNSIPMPYVLVDRVERQMNPVVDLRSWPVAFKLRTFRQTRDGFILSSQRDLSQPCNDCGGTPLQLTR